MSDTEDHSEPIDTILKDWPFVPGELSAREALGDDGRPVLQVRIDMGVMQMETTGRPDGTKPEGFDTYHDFLVATLLEDGESFELDGTRCFEIDREFMQYYHRRLCWLALREFNQATTDADHTLALMDFSTEHAPSEQWVTLHEQYRPFVLFHRTQSAALAQLEEGNPENATEAIDTGLDRLLKLFTRHGVEEKFDSDELVIKLQEMKNSVAEQFDLEESPQSLGVRLAQAITDEEFELAAKLRDELSQRSREKG